MDAEEIREHNRRLKLLRIQRARYGIDCPPHIQLEIDDIEGSLGKGHQRSSISKDRYSKICTYLVCRMEQINRIADNVSECMKKLRKHRSKMGDVNMIAAVFVSYPLISSLPRLRSDLAEEYKKFDSYLNKNRIFLPKDVYKAVDEYRALLRSSEIMVSVDILDADIDVSKLESQLDVTVDEIQKFLD